MKTHSHIFGTLATLALCLIIPACGGGGGGGDSSGGGGSSSGGSSSGGSSAAFIPNGYSKAYFEINTPGFDGEFVFLSGGRIASGGSVTVYQIADTATYGGLKIASGSVSGGTWSLNSSSSTSYNLTLNISTNKGTLTARSLILEKSSFNPSSSYVQGIINTKSGPVSLNGVTSSSPAAGNTASDNYYNYYTLSYSN